METVIIEGKEFYSIDEIHEYLKIQLDFPDYYGMNLDALWDLISGYIHLPIKIIWNDFYISEKRFEKDAIEMKEFFIDCEKREITFGKFFFEVK